MPVAGRGRTRIMMGSYSSFGDTRRRRRRLFYWRVLRLAGDGRWRSPAVGGYAYQVGVSASRRAPRSSRPICCASRRATSICATG